MKILRKGMKDKRNETDIRNWQLFLLGLNIYKGPVDGDYGPLTFAATKKFQKQEGLAADGVVGPRTYGAAFRLDYNPDSLTDDDAGKYSLNWPPKPDNLKSLSVAQRKKIFGDFDFSPAPTRSNPEGIKIHGNWTRENLTRVKVPQLVGVYGAPKNGSVFWHKKGVNQLLGLFQAWEDEGLIDLVKSWAGSWAPRYIRGSRTTLSNHARSTAFDINVPWNGLGRVPALVGKEGSVRELVPLAVEHGFYWGGWFSFDENRYKSTGGFGGRSDGMHFELAKIIK